MLTREQLITQALEATNLDALNYSAEIRKYAQHLRDVETTIKATERMVSQAQEQIVALQQRITMLTGRGSSFADLLWETYTAEEEARAVTEEAPPEVLAAEVVTPEVP